MEELRLKAKELGIKSYWNKKADRLEREIAEAEGRVFVERMKKGVTMKAPIIYTDEDKDILNKLNEQALRNYSLQMGGDALIYKARKKAFECYQGDRLLDHLSISMFQ